MEKIKLKDLFNKVKNSANNQESLTLRRMKLKECGINLDEILDLEIVKKQNKFKKLSQW